MNRLQAGNLRLVLASESPRRRALLEQAGLTPSRVVVSSIDETPRKAEIPRDHARRLAREKAQTARRMIGAEAEQSLVLAADTVVALGRRILPKALDAAMVADCLSRLSGRRHQVITAVAIMDSSGKLHERVVMTRVGFRRLTDGEIAAYCATREGEGKAGGYAIQGRASAFIPFINGSYTNVMGLPLSETVTLIRGLGFGASDV